MYVLDPAYNVPEWVTIDTDTYELVFMVPDDAAHGTVLQIGVKHGSKSEVITMEIFNCDPVEEIQYNMWDGYSEPLYRQATLELYQKECGFYPFSI